MKVIEGNLRGEGVKVAIVLSRFNEFVGGRLLEGALDCLRRHGVAEDAVTVYKVPGSFELPQVAAKVAAAGKADAVICLGVVIRGQTPHFEYIAAEAAKGIARVGIESKVPVVFGVITADTLEQAIDRAGAKSGNKGWNAALSALEMVNLYREMG